jgi:hypothetical protein
LLATGLCPAATVSAGQDASLDSFSGLLVRGLAGPVQRGAARAPRAADQAKYLISQALAGERVDMARPEFSAPGIYLVPGGRKGLVGGQRARR